MSKRPNSRQGIPNKAVLMLDQLFKDAGFSPEQEAMQALLFAKEMTLKGGNPTNEWGGTDQVQWAAAWLNGSLKLLNFVRPTMSAVAVKDVDVGKARTPMTTAEALQILKADPFAMVTVAPGDTQKVIDAMDSNVTPFKLPEGNK